MKKYMALAGVAAVILAFAAVWLGGLNQDEGWCLYAAQMVSEGKMVYRDFFYTQGPLMPVVYSAFSWAWTQGQGLLGARVLTVAIGFAGILFAMALARMMVPSAMKYAATTITFILLGSNLYHVYYLAIPKTYALASLFVMMGYYLLCWSLTDKAERFRPILLFVAGLSLSYAAGTRISMAVMMATSALGLFFVRKRYPRAMLYFAAGGALGLVSVYGPYLFDCATREGLFAAQRYHTARKGFDAMLAIGSLSRLVRWYLPIMVLAGLAIFRKPNEVEEGEPYSKVISRRIVIAGFLGVFVLHMAAPYPYEDYQVPIMGLLAAMVAASTARSGRGALLALGMTWACSFGSPLLEKWTTDGHDRLWTLKKEKCELQKLRDVAQIIEAIDPNGMEILTQDTYLAVETGRKVPVGLEMGPFSMLDKEGWKNLLENTTANVAALSGYTFAINPPGCEERPVDEQMEFWGILKRRYDFVANVDNFGQNSTPLIILKKKEKPE